MNLICSNCGKTEGPSATYCRDCYTVFPAEVRASANRAIQKSASLAAWKWVPVVALVVGGFLLTQVEYGDTKKVEEAIAAKPADPWARESKTERARPSDRAAGKGPGIADAVQSDFGAAGGASLDEVAGRKPRVSAAIRAANQYLGWVMQSDAELACPSRDPCQATIRFGSGEHGSYFVERYVGTTNTVIPANDEASRLLATHRDGTLEMKLPSGQTRSVGVEKRSSRWAFGATEAPFATNSEDIPVPRVR